MWLSQNKNHEQDEKLCSAYFRSGDKALLGELFEKHVRTMYGVCLFYLRDKDKAKDAVMQIFEKLITELRKNEVRFFNAWLSCVVRNHCISEIRKAKNNVRYESWLEFELQEAVVEEEERIESVDEDTMLKYLEECLPLLKPKQKTCVELFYLKNKSYQEISVQTGFSLNEVKSRIQNGKRNLKLLIEEKIRNEQNAA
jgi:RNA polymerase sigma factor (sigma-70 family)